MSRVCKLLIIPYVIETELNLPNQLKKLYIKNQDTYIEIDLVNYY